MRPPPPANLELKMETKKSKDVPEIDNLQKIKKKMWGSHRGKTLFQSSIGLRLSGYLQVLNPPNEADLLG